MIKTADDYRQQGFGKGFAWIDFANSQEWDGFGALADHLSETSWLALFLRRWSLAHRTPAGAPRADLRRLREFLRRAAGKLRANKPPSAKDVAALNFWLKIPAQQRLVERQNGFRLELAPVRDGWEWILSRIAASFAEMLESGERERLKICPNDGCRWIFYDQTKGRTRRWCSDRSCGNRDRVRRARAAAKKKK
jgi:predicted RNA-binding Zn ribbon-like protein